MSKHFAFLLLLLLICEGRERGFSLPGTNCMVTITCTIFLQVLRLYFFLKCVSHLKTLLKAVMNVENLVMVWDLEMVSIFSTHTLFSLALQTRVWNQEIIFTLLKFNVSRKFINVYIIKHSEICQGNKRKLF